MVSFLSELGWPNVALLVVFAGIALFATWRRGWGYRRGRRGGWHLTWRR